MKLKTTFPPGSLVRLAVRALTVGTQEDTGQPPDTRSDRVSAMRSELPPKGDPPYNLRRRPGEPTTSDADRGCRGKPLLSSLQFLGWLLVGVIFSPWIPPDLPSERD